MNLVSHYYIIIDRQFIPVEFISGQHDSSRIQYIVEHRGDSSADLQSGNLDTPLTAHHCKTTNHLSERIVVQDRHANARHCIGPWSWYSYSLFYDASIVCTQVYSSIPWQQEGPARPSGIASWNWKDAWLSVHPVISFPIGSPVYHYHPSPVIMPTWDTTVALRVIRASTQSCPLCYMPTASPRTTYIASLG